MKSVIIDRLIEIEDSVLSITDEIRDKEKDLPVKIHQKCNEIDQALKKEYDNTAANIKSEKEQQTHERLAELKKDSLERHKRIDDQYNNLHEQWEDEIFANIISFK